MYSIGVREELDEMIVKQLVDIGCPEEVQVIERRHVDPVEALQVGQSFGQPRHVLPGKQKEIITHAHSTEDGRTSSFFIFQLKSNSSL